MNPHEDVVAVELLSDNFQHLLDTEFESHELLFDRRTLKWKPTHSTLKSQADIVFNNSYQCLPKYKKFLQFLCNLHFNIARVMCTLH